MTGSLATTLRDWHDFYVTLATASATLVGAMFVVASIGSGILTHERATDTRTFLTPAVIHLASVLLGSALTMVPDLEPTWLGIVLGLASLGGLVYSGVVGLKVGRRKLVWSDRVWYGAVPFVGYAAALSAAAAFLAGRILGLDLLAGALALLLVAGIRNAWDLILFIVAEARGPR